MKKVLLMGMTPPLEGGSEIHIYEISSRIKNSEVLTQKNSKCKNKIEIPIIEKSMLLRNLSFFLSSFIYSIFLIITPWKKYSTIHIHENLLYLFIPFLSLRYKTIVTVHGIDGFKFYESKILWPLFKGSLKFAHEVIFVDSTEKDKLEKNFKKSTNIPNGVNLESYKELKKIKIEKKITTLGRMHKQKGLIYLLKAFEDISKIYPEYELQIIGKKEGKLYESLSSKFKNKKIIWKGFISNRDNLFKLFSSSEIIVFPSLWEALPWPALLEGLGSKRPVVASDLEGMKKIFTDKKELLLTKPKDIKEIKKAIIYLIKDKKRANEIGAKGKKASEKYTWDKVAIRVSEVYEKYLND